MLIVWFWTYYTLKTSPFLEWTIRPRSEEILVVSSGYPDFGRSTYKLLSPVPPDINAGIRTLREYKLTPYLSLSKITTLYKYIFTLLLNSVNFYERFFTYTPILKKDLWTQKSYKKNWRYIMKFFFLPCIIYKPAFDFKKAKIFKFIHYKSLRRIIEPAMISRFSSIN